jgi:hypothetical protein
MPQIGDFAEFPCSDKIAQQQNKETLGNVLIRRCDLPVRA